MAKSNSTNNEQIIQYRIGPKVTHARHDSAYCLAPGLFRSLKRGDKKKQKLEIIYKFGDKELIEFKGPEPLGADDLVVLQGLVAMAGPRKLLLRHDTPSEAGKVLREKLELKWDAIFDENLVIKSSFRKLAKEIGFDPDSGGDLKTMIKAIERLWTISVIVQVGNSRKGFRLLSYYGSESKKGKLLVALSSRVTEAIFGHRPHTRINMEEVRKLKSDPARILHQRLSALISQGETRKILPDTLVSYIWPDPAEGSTLRWRKMTLRKALCELVATEAWEVSGEYQIKRKGDFKPKKIVKNKG